MTPEQLEILVTYRIGQSHETLKEAEILFEQSAFRGAVNRAYHTMFFGQYLIFGWHRKHLL